MSTQPKSQADEQPTAVSRARIYPVLALVSLAPVLALLAWQGFGCSPVDDAWIFFRYARNFRDHSRVSFNVTGPGGPATSLAWCVAPGVLAKLGLDPILACLLLSALFAPVAVLGFFELLLDVTQNSKASAWMAVLFATCGQFIWWAALGMEITMQVAVGVWAIVAFVRGRMVCSGVLAGALLLVRPDGYALLAVLGIAVLVVGRNDEFRAFSKRAATFLIPACLIGAVPFLVNQLCYGCVLPPGGAGRRWLAATQHGLTVRPSPFETNPFSIMLGGAELSADYASNVVQNVFGASCWRSLGLPKALWRLVAYIWMLVAVTGLTELIYSILPLPKRRDDAQASVRQLLTTVLLALCLAGLLVLALLGDRPFVEAAEAIRDGLNIGRTAKEVGARIAAENLAYSAEILRLLYALCVTVPAVLLLPLLPSAKKAPFKRLPLLALAAWALTHFCAYALYLPYEGQGGRYMAPLLPLVFACLYLGANRLHAAVAAARSARFDHLKRILVIGLLATNMATMALWRDAYGNGMQVMREVYIPTGDWLKENVPPDEAVAVFDIGAIVYRAERDVIDMGGITDPECADYLWGRQGHAYLRKKNAKWAVLPVLLSVNFWAPQAGYLGVPGAPRLTAEQRFVVSDIEAYVRWQLYQARAISPEAWICRLRFPPEEAGKASPR